MAMAIVRWAGVVVERVMGSRVFGVWRVGSVPAGAAVCWVVIGVRVFGVRRGGSGRGVRCGFRWGRVAGSARCGFGWGRVAVSARSCGLGWGRVAVWARWCGFECAGRVAVSARWARFMVWRVGKVEAGELGWWSGWVCGRGCDRGHVSCWGGVTDDRGCAGTVVRLVVALGGRPGGRGWWMVGCGCWWCGGSRGVTVGWRRWVGRIGRVG